MWKWPVAFSDSDSRPAAEELQRLHFLSPDLVPSHEDVPLPSNNNSVVGAISIAISENYLVEKTATDAGDEFMAVTYVHDEEPMWS